MVGIGVIGFGYWGPNLARNFNDAPGARLVAVCDRDPARLAEARRRYPAARMHATAEELLADKDVNAVAIATPVSTHHALAMAALRSGRHALVEKPLAASSAHAAEIAAEAERRNLVVLVDHTFLYTGAVRKIAELSRSGELGDIYYCDSVRVNLGLFQHDVSVVWDLAVHDLSIIDHIVPARPRAVSAIGMAHVAGQQPNIAYITLAYDGPLIAHVHVNWLAPVKVRRTLIGGSRRMVVYDDLEPSDKVRIYDAGVSLENGPDGDEVRKMLAYRRTGDMVVPKLRLAEALETEANHFVACIEGKEKPLTPATDGLRIVKMLEAATQSLENNGAWVDL